MLVPLAVLATGALLAGLIFKGAFVGDGFEAFWKGSGYVLDPVHGGLVTYSSTPSTFVPQVESAGLEVVDLVGGRYPDVQAVWLTPWYYYACRKPLEA